ncbi:extracellular solute-binding protein [Nocardioides cheoyonin]|uniref:extracellular solute-binding protein n=1 Tax=Nocardioides cheoyonin TaxID=3156615 RepID=UPI0032B5B30B
MTRARRGRAVAAVGAAVLAGTTLAACGSSDGRATLNVYINPDAQATMAKLADQCSTDKYKLEIQLLPSSASDQRTQLARRLAARDSSTDLMSIDPVFVAEFASAGWLATLPEEYASKAVDDDVLKGPAESAQWDGKVVAFPQWANTQVTWYRKSLAEKAGLTYDDATQTLMKDGSPATWDDIIKAAADNGGTVGVQANKYEGYVVWINALVMGAGGDIVSDTEAGTDAKVDIDSDAGKAAAQVVQTLADSKAAQPDLSVSNEGTSLGQMYPSGGAGEFMVNWTFVYKNYEGLIGQPGGPANKAAFQDLGWARYPATVSGEESKPPIGGIDIGVGAYSKHKDYAMAAAQCLTNTDAEVAMATEAGLMPARTSAYNSPELKKAFPASLLELFQNSVDTGGLRPQSAYYSKISSAIQSRWHPPSSVSESSTPGNSASFLKDVLEGKALL